MTCEGFLVFTPAWRQVLCSWFYLFSVVLAAAGRRRGEHALCDDLDPWKLKMDRNEDETFEGHESHLKSGFSPVADIAPCLF